MDARIDLSNIANVGKYLPVTDEPPSPETRPEHVRDSSTKVMTMLFADAVGYSKLTDEQVPPFVQHFLGAIAALKEKHAGAVVVSNTWSDGLYMVFEDQHIKQASWAKQYGTFPTYVVRRR